MTWEDGLYHAPPGAPTATQLLADSVYPTQYGHSRMAAVRAARTAVVRVTLWPHKWVTMSFNEAEALQAQGLIIESRHPLLQASPVSHRTCLCRHDMDVHTDRLGEGCTSRGCLCLETPALVVKQAALRPPAPQGMRPEMPKGMWARLRNRTS